MRVKLEDNMVGEIKPVLKTCPFCGGGARIIVHHNEELSWIRYSVECYRCNACSDKYWLATLAEEAWNRRVGDDQ